MLLAMPTTDVTVDDIGRGYKSLVVSGIIIIGFIVLGIWWLKRNA
jgi:hypothetical protein